MNKQKGFTLIELLVVIAIIGVLASVVLASLNTARNKGADAAIIATLNGQRSQAELYYGTTDGYDGFCGSPEFAIASSSAGAQSPGAVSCEDTPSGYAFAAPLKTDSTKFFCADATSTTEEGTGAITTGVVACPK
jgi:prepilin-type N-terminal cleavage/methylation domain-containing protein